MSKIYINAGPFISREFAIAWIIDDEKRCSHDWKYQNTKTKYEIKELVKNQLWGVTLTMEGKQ